MNQCLLCLDFTPESLCIPCQNELPWVQECCPRCGRAAHRNVICALCQKTPCLWDRGVAPLFYSPPVASMILGLKQSRQLFYARTLANLFIQALPDTPRPELILPVPLHSWRLLKRGFNQSTELCKILAEQLRISYSPYYIKRLKHSPHQRGADKKTRKANVARAFSLIRPLPVSHIALVDDVFTTGETLTAVCKAIRQHHPDVRIEIWTIAQTALNQCEVLVPPTAKYSCAES